MSTVSVIRPKTRAEAQAHWFSLCLTLGLMSQLVLNGVAH